MSIEDLRGRDSIREGQRPSRKRRTKRIGNKNRKDGTNMVLDVNALGALLDPKLQDPDRFNNFDCGLINTYYDLCNLLENCPTDEIEIKPFEKDYMPYYDG